MMELGGWNLFAFKVFDHQYSTLVLKVAALREKQPEEYKKHPTTKLLAKVQHGIKDTTNDPCHPKFQMGTKVLGAYSTWRRVKNGLPARRRLFFRFFTEPKEIIFAWLNDQGTLRKEGSKTDVYAVFKKLLDTKKIPNEHEQLKEGSSDFSFSPKR